MRPSYRVNPDALRRARGDLGLTLDVRVKFERLRGRGQNSVALGRYNGTDPYNPAHQISLNPNQTVRAVNASLWHELMHARQCERIGSWPRFDSEYARQCRAVVTDPDAFYTQYRAAPWESEAYAEQHEYERGNRYDLILSAPCATVEP